MSMPTEIKNYDEFKEPLDKTQEKEITFEEKGDNFVFNVDGKEYSLKKAYQNFIDVYQMTHEKMSLILKTTEKIADLKNDIENDIETTQLIDNYIDKFKERKKATRWRKNNGYQDGEKTMDTINELAKDSIKKLKKKRKAIKNEPEDYDTPFDTTDYDAKLKELESMRNTASDTKRAELQKSTIINKKDANIYGEYNQETIDYQTQFNSILKKIAGNQAKLKEYSSIEQYFKNVINGTITHPAQTPYQCKYREDYKYLMNMRTEYPNIQNIIKSPKQNRNRVNTSTEDNTMNKENQESFVNISNNSNSQINNAGEKIEGKTWRERTTNALKNGSLVDFVGQGSKELLKTAGIDLKFNKQQQQTLRMAGVIWWGILVRKLLKKWYKKNPDRKLRKVALWLGVADALYVGMTWRELYTSSIKTLFGKGSHESKFLAGIMSGNSIRKVKNIEEKSEVRPVTTLMALGWATPKDKVIIVENGKFKYNDYNFQNYIKDLPKEMQQDAKENMKSLLDAKNTEKILNQSLTKLWITPKIYLDEKNENKSLVEIASNQNENKNSQMKKIDEELTKRSYTITDEGRYNIYLDYNKGDKIENKINNWAEKWRIAIYQEYNFPANKDEKSNKNNKTNKKQTV